MDYAVITEWNDSDYTEVALFPTEEKAREYVKFRYGVLTKNEMKSQAEYPEDERTFRPDKCYLDPDGNWGQMVWDPSWSGADPEDYTTMTIKVVGVTMADWEE